MSTGTPRNSEHPVEPLFLERWSPRAFDGTRVEKAALNSMFEAAHWAPSAFNAQPWRFIYALRGDSAWERLLGLLMPFNINWAQNAGALVFICSDTLIVMKAGQPPQPSHSHSFDAGAAWAFMALQAMRLGYHAHGMTGVDFERARSELKLPAQFRLEAAIAVGRRGNKSSLPESLQAREAPSDRKPINSLIYHGHFGAAPHGEDQSETV